MFRQPLISLHVLTETKENIISPELKNAGNKLYFFNHIAQENGLPNYNALKEVFEFIFENIKAGKIVSVKTVKEGGLAVALAKMSFGNRLGAEINADEAVLLTKNIGSLIIEAKEELSSAALQLIGEVKDSGL